MSQPQRATGRGGGRARATARGRPPAQAQSSRAESRRPGQPTGSPASSPGSSSSSAPSSPQRPPSAAGRRQSSGKKIAGLLAGVSKLSIASSGSGNSSHETGAQPSGSGTSRRQRQKEANSIPAELLPTRPSSLITKQGTRGQKVKVCANYFKMTSVTNWCLYHYNVSFNPEQERISIKKQLIRETMRQYGAYLFDGSSLFSSYMLRTPLEFVGRLSDDNEVKVTVQFTNDLQPSDYHYLQVFGVLIRKCLTHLNLTLIGRNFFDMQASIHIPHFNLNLFPGYITSIRQHERDILMCAEIITKVMRKDTASDLLKSCMVASSNFQESFRNAILGQTVITRYNNRQYKIADVDFDSNPTKTFDTRNGKITYMDYYLSRYEIRISNQQQPLLMVKSKSREVRAGQPDFIYLIPELCVMTGLSSEMTSDFRLMQAIAGHTRVNPNERVQRLNELNRRLYSNPAIVEDLRRWNMTIDRNLVTFEARQLHEVKIKAGKNRIYGSVKNDKNVDWTKELRSNPMFDCEEIKDWAVIYLSRNKQSTEYFVGLIIKAADGMQFSIKQPNYKPISGDRISDYLDECDRVLSEGTCQLIMTFLPNNRADRYNAVKKKLYIDRGIPSQVILDKTTRNKGVLSIATKVAVQLNCKRGGTPWSVDLPPSMMVVGFDVYHSPDSKCNSYGAMVASLNGTFSRYFSAVTAEPSGNELSGDFDLRLAQALRCYRENNDGFLPNSIFIYRDGVGEGQIPYVKEIELASIKKRLLQVYNGKPPKLVFVIVTKRINTRIFQVNDGTKFNNPMAGTVVDDVITFPHKYDFYLISQTVRQGTVSPTSYNVIHDDGGYTPDIVQKLTYYLTHLYYNWSGTIGVPAPCQYAHKLAYMAGQNLGGTPSERMNPYLFFL